MFKLVIFWLMVSYNTNSLANMQSFYDNITTKLCIPFVYFDILYIWNCNPKRWNIWDNPCYSNSALSRAGDSIHDTFGFGRQIFQHSTTSLHSSRHYIVLRSPENILPFPEDFHHHHHHHYFPVFQWNSGVKWS